MTPAAIITQTACAYGLAPSQLTSRSMRRRVAEARAVAAWLAYERGECTYAELGAVLGRERSWTFRMVERVDRGVRAGGALARRVAEVERLLGRPAGGEALADHIVPAGEAVALGASASDAG